MNKCEVIATFFVKSFITKNDRIYYPEKDLLELVKVYLNDGTFTSFYKFKEDGVTTLLVKHSLLSMSFNTKNE